jgi:hypothetical protein
VRVPRLIRIAIAAEELRLRHMIQRAAMRAGLAGIAAVLVLAALVFGHVAAWDSLRASLTIAQTAVILACADLVLGLVVAAVAARASEGAVEREALALRERALDEAMDRLTVTALLVRLLDLVAARPKA